MSTTTRPQTGRLSHTDIAVAFLNAAASGDVRRAYADYVSPSFRHHNPYFRGDAESLAAGMEENARQNPEKRLTVERTIAEGDLVAVHGRVRHKPNAPEIALIHIFRFDDANKIVELWDVGQAPPETSPNEYGMF